MPNTFTNQQRDRTPVSTVETASCEVFDTVWKNEM